MALQVQIVKVIADGQQCRVSFNVVATGSYSTGGDTLDFSKATADPTFQGMVAYIPSSQAPLNLDVWDAGGNIANGVFPILGASQSTCKVKFTSAFNTELSATTYPAGLLAAKLEGEAIFNENL